MSDDPIANAFRSVSREVDEMVTQFIREAGSSTPTAEQVRKWSMILPISTEMADPHRPAPPLSRWLRARWRLSEQWWQVRRRVGSWIAGVDLDD